MSITLITSIGRWLLPLLAAVIMILCGAVLVRGNRKTGIIGYVINAGTGESMPLKSYETSIGRSKLCDIVLNYNTVSRFHAVIARRGGRWMLFDTNSKTGTYVNKERVLDKKLLENGDTLVFGNAIFKFYEELPTEAEANEEMRRMQYSTRDQGADNIRTHKRHRGDVSIPQAKKTGCSLENCLTGELMPIDRLDQILIGRAPEAQIRIQKSAVSPYHAMISKNAHGRWILEDMGSSSGTLLNGVPITQPTPLYDNDVIEVCGYTIRFNDPN
ncbi:MAG: FHA domain-containing protein [Clostridia bacterium]|nr:FHA domain-containing protein [Clostridia bacterium]